MTKGTKHALNPASVGNVRPAADVRDGGEPPRQTDGAAATKTCRSILAGSGVADYRNSLWKDDNRRPTYLLLMEAKLVCWPCVASARKMERYCLS